MNRKNLFNINIKLIVSFAFLIGVALPVMSQKSKEATVINDTVKFVKTNVSNFNDLITIPYGTLKSRKELTSAISSIKSQELKKFNTPNLGNTLFGQLSGLFVSQSASAPGNNDNPGLSIRGKQTLQDNNLMVLVDGFETTWSNIMVDEIESVSVLKDAGALALFGLDGANGVLLITTKRGMASKKSEINFSSRFGMQSPSSLPSFVNNGDYAEMYNTAMLSDGKLISNGYFKNSAIVDYFKTGQYPFLYPNVNWYDETVKPNSMSQDYSLTIRGGTLAAKYFVALGYADYQGLYKNTDAQRSTNSNYDLKRYNIRANFDVAINKFLSAQMNLRGTIQDKTFPNASENTLWQTMALFTPYPVKTESGSWGGTQGYAANPVASILQQGYQSINDKTVDANVKVIGKLDVITKGLQIYGQVNFSNFYYSTYNKTRGYAYSELNTRPDLITSDTPPNTMPYDKVTKGDTDLNFDISQGSGNQTNRTSILGGIEYERSFQKNNVYASAIYFQEIFKGAGSDMPYAKQRAMGRLNYNYSEKYYAEFGYSYAGSENFPQGSRFGFFPTLSVGWMLNKENFLVHNTKINLLKIRASYGLLGNDGVGNSGRFIYNQYYVGGSTYYLGNNLGMSAGTYTQGNIANPNVTWEKSVKANIGVDATIFNKLSFSIDFFNEQRNDIFISPSNYLPSIIGANYYNVNKGKTKSSGGEFEMRFNDKIGKVGYFIGGNVSYAKNTIVDMKEPPRAETYLNAAGRSINQPFVLQAIGFFKDENDIKQSPKQLFGQVVPGDIKYKDQNNDGFIDDNDRTATGNTSYPNIYYGFNMGADYINIDISFFLQGAANRTVSLLDNNIIIPFLNGGVRPSQWVKDNYWTPERGDNAKFPRLTTVANDNNYRASTLWQRDGSFLKVRSVEIGYTLPAAFIRRMKINSLRIYLSGNNIFTFQHINEINVDPEIMNVFVYPTTKSYNFGLNLKF